MVRIDKKLISYLEDLSLLTLSDAEKKQLSGDLEKIIKGFSKLAELDTSGVEGLSHPFDAANAFREDEVTPSLERRMILQNAPDKTGEAIIAPRVIE